MEQILNKEHQDFFSDILANPEKVNAMHAAQLVELVELYPQSGILRAMLAHANQFDQENFQRKLKTASIYAPDRKVLYQLINYPERFVSAVPQIAEPAVLLPVIKDDEPAAEAVTVNYFHDPQALLPASSEIDDEIYDEIIGIEDIQFDQVYTARQDEAPADKNLEDLLMAQFGLDHDKPVENAEEPAVVQELIDKPDDYGLAAELKDRMAHAADGEQDYELDEDELTETPLPQPAFFDDVKFTDVQPVDDERISKYNDDKMPYTFMWWLDKTRKEHAENHQPYAPVNKPGSAAITSIAVSEELQQQYYENIFHVTTIEELDKNLIKTQPEVKPDVEPEAKRKEDEIIERFIQEDPQIKPPSNDKLDNENKAKKSAEDQDELVSETLARIYLDQMLYHKAISTYQKLLLKFPEKSSYFVAQIKLLEKKIN